MGKIKMQSLSEWLLSFAKYSHSTHKYFWIPPAASPQMCRIACVPLSIIIYLFISNRNNAVNLLALIFLFSHSLLLWLLLTAQSYPYTIVLVQIAELIFHEWLRAEKALNLEI